MRRPRILSVVPLAALTVVLGVLAAAVLTDPPLDFPFSEPPPGAPIPSVDLSLGDLTLTGRVISPDGAPVDGAGVSLKEGIRPVWTWTSSDGSFALTELDAGPKRILVTALGLQATAFDVELGPGTADTVELKLERKIIAPEVSEGLSLQDLRGRIDLGPLASTEAGFEVLFQPLLSPLELDGGFPRRVAVDRAGRFEAPLLQEGGYRIILLSPDNRGADGPDLLSTGAQDVITVQHGADGETGELELTSKAGMLRGTVTAPSTETGGTDRPVRGALVRAEPLTVDPAEPRRGTLLLEADDFRATRTDPEGRFVLRDLRPGRYRVTVVAGRARRQTDVLVPAGGAVDVQFDTTR